MRSAYNKALLSEKIFAALQFFRRERRCLSNEMNNNDYILSIGRLFTNRDI